MIGAGGVERVIEIDLNKAEQKMFEKSVEAGAEALRGLREDRARHLVHDNARRAAMNIHEYQGKQLLKGLGAPVADGVASLRRPREAEAAAKNAARPALCREEPDPCRRPRQGQVQGAAAGRQGRRAAGEVGRPTSSPTPRRCWATRWSPSRPVRPASRSTASISRTAPTSSANSTSSLLVDRTVGRIAFVVSTEGGMDIEAVAHDTPEKIITLAIDPLAGVTALLTSTCSNEALQLDGDAAKDGGTLFPLLYKAFVEKDMSLLEVNPLIVMKNGHLRVLDAKVSFDNNALFRHPEIVELRDTTEEDEKEIEASKYDLAYVALDGNIGCMVNGAGLAMATMDIIKLYGAEPG